MIRISDLIRKDQEGDMHQEEDMSNDEEGNLVTPGEYNVIIANNTDTSVAIVHSPEGHNKASNRRFKSALSQI